ncbi:MAG TPA: serine/threonine-protein kinase [Nocardioides sp.]|nr:serine/threonine-protein kinase [Nocardioides sp.]
MTHDSPEVREHTFSDRSLYPDRKVDWTDVPKDRRGWPVSFLGEPPAGALPVFYKVRDPQLDNRPAPDPEQAVREQKVLARIYDWLSSGYPVAWLARPVEEPDDVRPFLLERYDATLLDLMGSLPPRSQQDERTRARFDELLEVVAVCGARSMELLADQFQVVHRDPHPANFMFNHDVDELKRRGRLQQGNDAVYAVLIDFSHADVPDFKTAGALEGVREQRLGHVAYQPPNLIAALAGHGRVLADLRSDLFGLAVTLVEAITGRVPWRQLDDTAFLTSKGLERLCAQHGIAHGSNSRACHFTTATERCKIQRSEVCGFATLVDTGKVQYHADSGPVQEAIGQLGSASLRAFLELILVKPGEIERTAVFARVAEMQDRLGLDPRSRPAWGTVPERDAPGAEARRLPECLGDDPLAVESPIPVPGRLDPYRRWAGARVVSEADQRRRAEAAAADEQAAAERAAAQQAADEQAARDAARAAEKATAARLRQKRRDDAQAEREARRLRRETERARAVADRPKRTPAPRPPSRPSTGADWPSPVAAGLVLLWLASAGLALSAFQVPASPFEGRPDLQEGFAIGAAALVVLHPAVMAVGRQLGGAGVYVATWAGWSVALLLIPLLYYPLSWLVAITCPQLDPDPAAWTDRHLAAVSGLWAVAWLVGGLQVHSIVARRTRRTS